MEIYGPWTAVPTLPFGPYRLYRVFSAEDRVCFLQRAVYFQPGTICPPNEILYRGSYSSTS